MRPILSPPRHAIPKQIGMGDQREGEKQRVDDEQHDGNRNAEPDQPLRARRQLATWKAAGRTSAMAASVSMVAWERAPAGLKLCSRWRTPPASMAAPSTKQDIADDRAGNRGFHHIVQSGMQRDERDDELGRIAECRVEKPANAFAEAFREHFGGAAHPSGKRHDRKGGSHEDQQITLGRENSRGRPRSAQRREASSLP